MASYVSPMIKDKFETLSTDLKNLILERNVQLNNMPRIRADRRRRRSRLITVSPSFHSFHSFHF